MPEILQYLIKVSIGLSVVYLFYQLLLRRLTFYDSNRWYLLGYTLFAFIIPLINVTAVLDASELGSNSVVRIIPTIHEYAVGLEAKPLEVESRAGVDVLTIFLLMMITGMAFSLVLFVVRYISFLSIRRKAQLISNDGVKLYQVDKPIIPFSFGNSVFINVNQHDEKELREIVRHEFIHVKQKHTIDLIWAEFLCIVNWYNPFAWLLKRAIRQNLEFIADNKVLESGLDKRSYQYLLLKVIGNNHFSIASQFNFSSLKKRIAMMNKMRSARLHLVKFLFILPLVAVLLLAFRDRLPGNKKFSESTTTVTYSAIAFDVNTKQPVSGVEVRDAASGATTLTDNKGYFDFKFTIAKGKTFDAHLYFNKPGYKKQISAFRFENKHELENSSLVEIIAMEKGNETESCRDCYTSISTKYIGNVTVGYDEANDYYQEYVQSLKNKQVVNQSDTVPEVRVPNSKGYLIDIKDLNGKCEVVVKDKNNKVVKKVLLDNWKEKSSYYEDLYGEIPPPPKVIRPSQTNVTTATSIQGQVSIGVSGQTTVASTAPQVALTGEPVQTTSTAVTAQGYSSTGVAASPAMVAQGTADIAVVGGYQTVGQGVSSATIKGETILKLEIKKSTTKEQLDQLIARAKEKGVELVFETIEWDNNNQIQRLRGKMKSKDSRNEFFVTDFTDVILMVIKDGEKIRTQVIINNNKKVVS